MLTLDKWPGLPDSPLVPLNQNYANFDVPVKDSFPWGEIVDAAQMPVGRMLALTVFRSISNPGAEDKLQRIDDLVLGVTKEKPGGLFYFTFQGDLCPEELTRKSLSVCGWENPEASANGVDSPEHRRAVAYAREAYKIFKVEQWTVGRLIIGGTVEFLPYSDFDAIQSTLTLGGMDENH